MEALARTERVVAERLAAPANRPRRAPARRSRARSPHPNDWNVLAQELVSFIPPLPHRNQASPRLLTSSPSRNLAPGRQFEASRAPRVVQPLSPRPSAAQMGDRAANVGSAETVGSRRAASQPRGLRRLLPGVATLAVLVSVWFGVGTLASLHRPVLSIPAAASKVPGGYLYVVRPGDTLWSIASKLEPGGDPRPLVSEFERQLHGAVLIPGDELKLP